MGKKKWSNFCFRDLAQEMHYRTVVEQKPPAQIKDF